MGAVVSSTLEGEDMMSPLQMGVRVKRGEGRDEYES